MSLEAREKQIIGANALVSVGGVKNVPAKVDTGADSSSIWASNISISPDGILCFSLFAPGSKYYTGQVLGRINYKAVQVRSSNGQSEVRYSTQIPVIVDGRKIKATFTLSDRSKNSFPILIGRRTLNGKFLVDVSRQAVTTKPPSRSRRLSRELAQNPRLFHQKHISK